MAADCSGAAGASFVEANLFWPPLVLFLAILLSAEEAELWEWDLFDSAGKLRRARMFRISAGFRRGSMTKICPKIVTFLFETASLKDLLVLQSRR